MPYKYAEPVRVEFEPLKPGQYDFTVIEIQDPETNEKGNFVLLVKLQIKGTDKIIYDYPSAGKSKDGKPYDTIAPFLKAVRRNPAVDEEPDFSARNLIGARGTCFLKLEKFEGVDRNKVYYYVYDREQTAATVSQGAEALPKTYHDTEKTASSVSATKDDNIPF